MLISKAYAAALDTAAEATAIAPDAPTPMEAFMWNMGLILLLVVMFYVLLIMPQQRRFKEHTSMLSQLKKGDKIVTGGGFVGTIDKIIDDHEVLVDLGNGIKVTALRSSLQGQRVPLKSKPANDQKAKT
ncbi:MAG: preprotein translocase subunit YajC [Alphaproteobacteria bacterium PRO2]|nr:preprotein translocase subunit YajC [Alphaproteobacteria bacterium PRO2]